MVFAYHRILCSLYFLLSCCLVRVSSDDLQLLDADSFVQLAFEPSQPSRSSEAIAVGHFLFKPGTIGDVDRGQPVVAVTSGNQSVYCAVPSQAVSKKAEKPDSSPFFAVTFRLFESSFQCLIDGVYQAPASIQIDWTQPRQHLILLGTGGLSTLGCVRRLVFEQRKIGCSALPGASYNSFVVKASQVKCGCDDSLLSSRYVFTPDPDLATPLRLTTPRVPALLNQLTTSVVPSIFATPELLRNAVGAAEEDEEARKKNGSSGGLQLTYSTATTPELDNFPTVNPPRGNFNLDGSPTTSASSSSSSNIPNQPSVRQPPLLFGTTTTFSPRPFTTTVPITTNEAQTLPPLSTTQSFTTQSPTTEYPSVFVPLQRSTVLPAIIGSSTIRPSVISTSRPTAVAVPDDFPAKGDAGPDTEEPAVIYTFTTQEPSTDTVACPLPCANGGTCIYAAGGRVPSPVCDCPDGFTGRFCEQFESACTLPCQNAGLCVRKTDGDVCECPEGYSGLLCESQKPCSLPCANGGTCTFDETGGLEGCICREGFRGDLCLTSVPVSPIQPQGSQDDGPRTCSLACKNNGTCSFSSPDDMICLCEIGFLGNECELKDLCYPNPCENRGACKLSQEEPQKPICECSPGFLPPYCKVADPCTPNPCYNNAVSCVPEFTTTDWVDTISFKCNCAAGYSGDLCEFSTMTSSSVPTTQSSTTTTPESTTLTTELPTEPPTTEAATTTTLLTTTTTQSTTIASTSQFVTDAVSGSTAKAKADDGGGDNTTAIVVGVIVPILLILILIAGVYAFIKVRRWRREKGVYNPSAEEQRQPHIGPNALPMTTIAGSTPSTKDERLI